MASPSAVAIIETPYSYVVEGRPNLPGKLAHAGKLQLFGGHSEEFPTETIRRELKEELNYEPKEDPEILWAGEVDSQNRAGEPVRRYVSLFRVYVNSVAELDLQVPGEIVEIPKNEIGLEDYKRHLTDFALEALTGALHGIYDYDPL